MPDSAEKYARDLMNPDAWQHFCEHKDYGFSTTFKNIGRFRINAFWQRHSVSIALRPVQDNVPTLASLNLPSWISDFALRPHGLILISGPAGHGKSTTLSAMVDIINSHRLRKFIREGKTHQIRAQPQSGAEDFISIDIALAELCKAGKIHFDDALIFADDRMFLRDLVQLPANK